MDACVPQFKILVVDDQYGSAGLDRESFLGCVQRDESEFVFATGQTDDGRNIPELTLDLVERLWERQNQFRLSLILLDVRFPDEQDPHADRFGFTLLRTLRERFGRALPIVMLTTEKDVRGAANEASADGFLPKENLSQRALEDQLFRNGVFPDMRGKLLGSAPPFLLTLREFRRVVRSGVMELLLLGETGTGKSDLAEWLHDLSGRPRELFKRWFARSTNPELHYDALFGHWSGAFDGAREHKAGVAERAHRGTLFIDEIAELNPSVQTDLLEYRQRSSKDNLRRIRRQGHYPTNRRTDLDLMGTYSPEEDRVLVDTFLVTATNKPIDDPAWRERAGFRQDLFNRLGHRITVPPLRERVEDIAPLFLVFFERASGRHITLTPDAQRRLQAHEWRGGNVEEVRQVAAAVTTRVGAEFDEIYPHHFDGLLGERYEPAAVGMSRVSSERTVQKPSTTEYPADEGPHVPVVSATRLVDFEVQSLWGIAERLRTAVVETRRPGRPGTLADIFKHATGVDYAATDVKREVKDILAPWFAPNERQAARWVANPHYQELAERVRADVVLSSLYRYSAGEINWNEARVSMAAVFGGDVANSDRNNQ